MKFYFELLVTDEGHNKVNVKVPLKLKPKKSFTKLSAKTDSSKVKMIFCESKSQSIQATFYIM